MRWLFPIGCTVLMLFFLVVRENPRAGELRPAKTVVQTTAITVRMNDWEPYYQPFVANAPPETPVRWVNPTPSPHSVRHDGCKTEGPCSFNSGSVAPDGQFVLPGLPPGRYPYHCELHPVMRGILVVKEEPSVSNQPDDERTAQTRGSPMRPQPAAAIEEP